MFVAFAERAVSMISNKIFPKFFIKEGKFIFDDTGGWKNEKLLT